MNERYPEARFPEATIMVNLVIENTSRETQSFKHACLSVPCANRAMVISPLTIEVSYLDALADLNQTTQTFRGIDAVVLWHELMHILEGETYMDVTFKALEVDDLRIFIQRLQQEIMQRPKRATAAIPCLTVPPFHQSIDLDNKAARLNQQALDDLLPNIAWDCLTGLVARAELILNQRLTLPNAHARLFAQAKQIPHHELTHQPVYSEP